MVSKKIKFKMFLTILVLIALALSACSSYEFGDVSRIYCGATNTEVRADLKVTLKDKGIDIGIDYCASVGLVDAFVLKPIQNKKD